MICYCACLLCWLVGVCIVWRGVVYLVVAWFDCCFLLLCCVVRVCVLSIVCWIAWFGFACGCELLGFYCLRLCCLVVVFGACWVVWVLDIGFG